MANAKKRCKHCRKYFPTEDMINNNLGFYCTKEHMIDDAVKCKPSLVAKGEKIRKKISKERVKTRSQWLREAQAVFNRFIRLRDSGSPCISCCRHHTGQYHAGHYLSVGSNPELRFDESNCHKQCAPCNNHLSGNIANYRPNLIKKIGAEQVEWLEGPHEPAKHTIDDCKTIIKIYKLKCKELE